MDLLEKLCLQLKMPNYFNIHFITELNIFICKKLELILSEHNFPILIPMDKYYLLQQLIKIGIEIEMEIGMEIENKKEDVVSLQLNSFSHIVIPIINKLKEICAMLNYELVEDIKFQIENKLKDNTNINLIKYLQINSLVKSFFNQKQYQIPFEEFGISIKVLNVNYKNIFKELIEQFGIFTIPDKTMYKKFDWVWVVSDFNIDPNNYRNNDMSIVDKTDINHNNILTDIYPEINSETTNDINLNNDNVESFKIVQSNYVPITNDLSINKYLIDSSNNFQDKTFTEKNKFTKSINSIIIVSPV